MTNTLQLPAPNEAGVIVFPDGSMIGRRHGGRPGFWATWPPAPEPGSYGIPRTVRLRGEDPNTGREVDWVFKTVEEAAQALADADCGPAGSPQVSDEEAAERAELARLKAKYEVS